MPVSPYLLSTRPKEGVFMDPLSEVFGSMRIDKSTYTRLEATAPWGFRSPGGECTGVNFVLVIRGSGLLRMKKQSESISLSGGDVFILFDDEPYTLVDHPRSKIIDCSEVEKLRVHNVIEIGGGGAPTTFVSGSFAVALVPFAADQSVFYIKPLSVSRISPGERGALPTLLKPLQELDGW